MPEWKKLEREYWPQDWVLLHLRRGFERYTFGRFRSGQGWHDTRNNSLNVDDITHYMELTDPTEEKTP